MLKPQSMSDPQQKYGGLIEFIKTIVYAVLIAGLVRTVAFEPFNIPSGSMIPTLLVGDYLFVSKFSYGYSHFSLPFGPDLFAGRIFGSVPERGDVAVFREPSDTSTDFIKRVIGLPGDKIQVVHGLLVINGKPVERKRIDDYVETDSVGSVHRTPQYLETLPGSAGKPGKTHLLLQATDDGGCAPVPRTLSFPNGVLCPDNTPVYTVPADHYFMMGDNRDDSEDSRFLSVVGYVPAENLIGRAEVLFFSTDGSAGILEPWGWPWAIRWRRFFNSIQ